VQGPTREGGRDQVKCLKRRHQGEKKKDNHWGGKRKDHGLPVEVRPKRRSCKRIAIPSNPAWRGGGGNFLKDLREKKKKGRGKINTLHIERWVLWKGGGKQQL